VNVPQSPVFYGFYKKPRFRVEHFTEQPLKKYRDCSPTDLLKSGGAGKPLFD
jgi:hypothetical protein